MANNKKIFLLKKRFLMAASLAIVIVVLILGYYFKTRIHPPEIKDTQALFLNVTVPDSGLYAIGRNRLKQSSSGLWELYIEGEPFTRGVVSGKLTRTLIAVQEQAFVDRIRQMIPSDFYLRFLKYFIYWFNRDLEEYVPEEYREEIYGISFSASGKFDFIGNPYQRILNYHSAHDIGHALQDLALVGCSSFGAWGAKTPGGKLLIGRNFDFYMGEEFARNKIVCFEKPDSGYRFMMVTWAGMIGTVSGMNEKGLTVTINAAKSEIPWSARTPISILAREILQYSTNISEAMKIAGHHQTFVSESILVGSAEDNIAAIIEKSPFMTTLVMPGKDYIICTNHYQGEAFRSDPLNVINIAESASAYRYNTIREAIDTTRVTDVPAIARILRDRKGRDGRDIGLGNEKAVNQLLAHHSVIFDPSAGLVWVSTSPWQLGAYVCYDLKNIFNTFANLQKRVEITEADKTIPPDPFLNSGEYRNFVRYSTVRDSLQVILKGKEGRPPDRSFTDEWLALNPSWYEGYEIAGDLYSGAGDKRTALFFYQKALSKEIPVKQLKEGIIRKMSECIVKSKDQP